MRRLLFWAAVVTLLYTYLLFPIIVLVRALIRARPHASAAIRPTVSMVIAAHNEAATRSSVAMRTAVFGFSRSHAGARRLRSTPL